MKTKLKWVEVDGKEWCIYSPILRGSVEDFATESEFAAEPGFEICTRDPDEEWEFFPCESLDDAKLEVERRIREAARPLFADVIAERDAALARVAELEAGGNDELTAAWMAGRESAKDEVAALKAELNGLRALCNEAVTFAESHGVIWTVELLSRLRAAIQDRTIDPAGGHDDE